MQVSPAIFFTCGRNISFLISTEIFQHKDISSGVPIQPFPIVNVFEGGMIHNEDYEFGDCKVISCKNVWKVSKGDMTSETFFLKIC